MNDSVFGDLQPGELMTIAPPDVSIIIVNWNSCELLRQCLVSIPGAAGSVTWETIVVDNASFDGADRMIASEFPTVRFVQNPVNAGFAKANNLGFEYACGRNILFLNPDTELVGCSLETLNRIADQQPAMGIVGPKLLNSDLTVQMDSIKAFPSLLNQLLDSHYLKRRLPKLSIWGMRPLFDSADVGPANVDVVSGACLMIKSDVFEKVGQFSTRYFMYSEDVDLCYKVRQAGRTVCLEKRAEVIHHGGKSSSLTPVSQFAAVLTRESRFQFLTVSRGSAYALAYRGLTACVAVSRLAALGVMWPYALLAGRRISSAFSKWRSVLRWSVGGERWVKTLD